MSTGRRPTTFRRSTPAHSASSRRGCTTRVEGSGRGRGADHLLRSLRSGRAPAVLYPPAISDRRCSLRDGICAAVPANGRRPLSRSGRSLSRSAPEHGVPGQVRAGLGISVRLGHHRRHHPDADAAHHDATVRVRGVCRGARDRPATSLARVMRSIAEHARMDYRNIETGDGARHLHVHAAGQRSRPGRQRQRLSLVPADESQPTT